MSGREPAVEVEYPLAPGATRRWTAAQALTVGAVVGAVATLLVGFPSYGLTDTTTFGRGVHGWGVTWCLVTGVAAVVLAMAAVVVHGATRAAASRALERAAAADGAARRVPVVAQRAMVTADPWAPTSTMAYVGVAADLQRATRTPGVAALAGRGLVGAGGLLLAAGATALPTGPAPVLVVAAVLLLMGAATTALGVRRLATDPVAGRERREVVRAAWPVDPLAGLPGSTPTGRKRRRRSRRPPVDFEKP